MSPLKFATTTLLFAICACATLPAKETKVNNLTAIPAASYLPFYSQGSEPAAVDAFYLATHVVTNREFLDFVTERPSWRRSRVKPIFADAGYLKHWTGDLSFDPEIADSPVVNVSWFAARAYCAHNGLRLPTLNEWEYVARASEDRADATDDPDFKRGILNWYARPTPAQLEPVGSTFTNFYGVADMHGLVWEWVSDFNSVFTTGESRGDGAVNRQFFCAAGVDNATDPGDYAAFMRFAFRASLEASYTVSNLGFRCAKDR